jgi:hypothetical protein
MKELNKSDAALLRVLWTRPITRNPRYLTAITVNLIDLIAKEIQAKRSLIARDKMDALTHRRIRIRCWRKIAYVMKVPLTKSTSWADLLGRLDDQSEDRIEHFVNCGTNSANSQRSIMAALREAAVTVVRMACAEEGDVGPPGCHIVLS